MPSWLIQIISLLAVGFIAFIILIFARDSARVRRFLLYLLFLLSFARHYFIVSLPVIGSPRLLLSIILLVSFGDYVVTVLIRLYRIIVIVPVLLWTLYACFSSLVVSSTPNPTFAYEQVGNFAFMLLIICFIASSSEKRIVSIMLFLSLSFLVNSFLDIDSFIPFLKQFSFPEGIGTTHQTVGRNALYGMLLIIGIIPEMKKTWQKLSVKAVFMFSVIAVGLSGARSPAAAFIVVLMLWRRGAKWWLTVAFILLIVLCLTNYFSVESEFANARYSRLLYAIRSGDPTSVNEVRFRAENVTLALQVFRQNPLFGTGTGTWLQEKAESEGQIGLVLAVHNGWALMAAEMGLVGYIVFAFAVYSIVKLAKFGYSDNLTKRIGFVGILGLLAIGVTSFGGDNLTSREFFLFAALVIGTKLKSLDAITSPDFVVRRDGASFSAGANPVRQL